MSDLAQKEVMKRRLPVMGHGGSWLKLVAVSSALFVLLPLLALVVIAFSGTTDSLGHIMRTVLPVSGMTTVLLLAGVALFTGIIGTVCAWLITFHTFPLRGILAWALMLPLAIPTYISAYAFVEFMSFTGPVQTLVRAIGGYEKVFEYWFPSIRNLPGAIFVLGLVLFPYVYMSVRVLFHFQGARMVECARTLGSGQGEVFLKVLAPMARPAIALGMVLAMMEAINDIGAMEYLGVRTLTFSVFSVWLNQSDMAGAAQIALILLVVVFALILMERRARAGQRYFETSTVASRRPYSPVRLTGGRALAATTVCALPVLFGFGVPLFELGGNAVRYLDIAMTPALWSALISGVSLALIASAITTIIALVLSYMVRSRARLFGNTGLMGALVRIASIGYAIPGIIIALGIFLPLATFDNWMSGLSREWFGFSTGLLITGSGATLVFAYVVRFMAVAEGTLDGGFRKLSPSLDRAARSLGRNETSTLASVLLPLMRPAVITAAILVFVDSLKELSATVMLKPFGIETLATHIYNLASRGRIEEASLACIIIVALGIVPLIILSKTMMAERR